ncbi:hypothetical protein [Actinoplanes couchii]|uniref:hypothetical protein n=1 Tax=Actinoplanes couchii TaxID=403638 RepID=UPI0019429221|nr:hypothetical protein [Actinoplanes couchii]MDR6317931.1 hypothetical protein [Actinoplanes couchii]
MTRDTGESEAGGGLPVVLVEVVNFRALQSEGQLYPLTMALAGKLGLAQAQAGMTPSSAVNWTFRDGPRCELRDPTGAVLARFRHAIDPRWQAAARVSGTVLVLYGGALGVRPPDGLAAASYDDRTRNQELHASLAAGEVLAGVVTYLQE